MENVYRIYYMKPEHFRDGICGLGNPTVATLSDTHVFLREIEVPIVHVGTRALDWLYHHSQGEIWSPNGEARSLIEEKGLRHTSMSVGDVIEDPDGTFWVVASIGFAPLS